MTSTTATGKTRPLNLQEQIEKKARDLWGDDVVVEVDHEKSKGDHALGRAAPNGWTAVRVKINGKATEISLHYNRSQAFKGALKEIEKLFERSLKEVR
jgi:hypothetical protein